MCGEHGLLALGLDSNLGSSPHVRGALTGPLAVGAALGIIPACAGSTQLLAFGIEYMWDHPRMCGEHGRVPHDSRGWGGIIPACAGSTRRTCLA